MRIAHLAAVAALFLAAPARGGGPYSGPEFSNSMFRHHGLGEGHACRHGGLRSLHGLGDGYCFGRVHRFGPVFRYPAAPHHHKPHRGPQDARRRAPRGSAASIAPGADAWRERAEYALRDFAIRALRSPEDTGARAGFGIAAAMLGQHERALRALRGAFAADAAALQAMQLDDRTARIVRGLRAAWRRGDVKLPEPDLAFMDAALNVLLDEGDAARSAIARALEAGDDSPAAAAIRDLLAPEAPRRARAVSPDPA